MLLRVLLLAVWFNTVVGMPLHAAEHLPGHGGSPASAALQRLAAPDTKQVSVPDAAPPGSGHDHDHDHDPWGHDHADHGACEGEDHASAHAACTWCPSHAQLAMALAAPLSGLPPALAGRAVFRPAAAAAFVPQPERWRYASRDPPRPALG
jgi:hypothetical protein